MQRQRGFTLIELLVVISIIALAASIVFASLAQTRSRARDIKRVRDLKEVQKALELYRLVNNDVYPASPRDGSDVSCWECNTRNIYDKFRLSALEPFLKPRPCDPSNPGPGCGQFEATKGYFYRVGNNRKDYKIFIIGTVENPNNIPSSLCYFALTNCDSLAIASSLTSQGWEVVIGVGPSGPPPGPGQGQGQGQGLGPP